jgi:transposase
VGAPGWSYYVPYRSDLDSALQELRRRVLDEGDYWWAVPYELGKSAADFADRDKEQYRQRNVAERCINRLKQWRGLAVRTDKLAVHYQAALTLAGILLWTGP